MVKIYPGELTAIDLTEVKKTRGIRALSVPSEPVQSGTWVTQFYGRAERLKGHQK